LDAQQIGQRRIGAVEIHPRRNQRQQFPGPLSHHVRIVVAFLDLLLVPPYHP
jgi:hypothetical protein